MKKLIKRSRTLLTATLLNKPSLKWRVLNTLLKFTITVIKLSSQDKVFNLGSFKFHVLSKPDV